jgi:hypothetical protein
LRLAEEECDWDFDEVAIMVEAHLMRLMPRRCHRGGGERKEEEEEEDGVGMTEEECRLRYSAVALVRDGEGTEVEAEAGAGVETEELVSEEVAQEEGEVETAVGQHDDEGVAPFSGSGEGGVPLPPPGATTIAAVASLRSAKSSGAEKQRAELLLLRELVEDCDYDFDAVATALGGSSSAEEVRIWYAQLEEGVD